MGETLQCFQSFVMCSASLITTAGIVSLSRTSSYDGGMLLAPFVFGLSFSSSNVQLISPFDLSNVFRSPFDLLRESVLLKVFSLFVELFLSGASESDAGI